MMLETDDLFDDGEHIMYVNGEYRDDSDIGKLMHDFCCSDPDQMLLSEFRSISKYYKETQEGVATMCKALEEMRDEAAKRNSIEIAKNLINLGLLTLEQISSVTGLTINQLTELAKA